MLDPPSQGARLSEPGYAALLLLVRMDVKLFLELALLTAGPFVLGIPAPSEKYQVYPIPLEGGE
jgi:hypothetical protein